MATEDVESVDGRSGSWSRCSAARLRSYLRIFLTHLFSHVGLCGLVVGYAIVGALTFQGLESPNEHMTRTKVSRERLEEREKCLQDMWIITDKFNVLHRENWTEAMTERLRTFEEKLVTTINEGGYKVDLGVDDANAVKMQWSFSGALLYSVTVITTIGYGNIAPKTESGKLVTILYALIGVPLMLLCLTNIGDLLANAFKFAYARLCCVLCRSKKRRYRPPRSVHCDNSGSGSGTRFSQPTPDTPTVKIPLAPSEDVNEEPVAAGGAHESTGNSAKSPSSSTTTKGMGDDGMDTVNVERLPRRLDATETRVPIALVLAFVAGYLCLGAAIFSLWEEWTFLNGAYFCFITLSTIGFGDLVPGTGILEPGKQEEHFRLIVCCVYLILGLAVIAMSFNLVQAEVTAKCKQIGRNLGILVDDDSSDD